MTDRPILFSAPMVQALLARRKTQTRRLLFGRRTPAEGAWHVSVLGGPGVVDRRHRPVPLQQVLVNQRTGLWVAPKYAVGDRLWVREQWSPEHRLAGIRPADIEPGSSAIWWWADGDPVDGDWTPPRVSIHMPRWVSRITLTVTEVRMMPLRDITETDAAAEGIEGAGAVTQFEALWRQLHGEFSWASNPWVVALSFSATVGNIDHVALPSHGLRHHGEMA